MIKGQLIKKSRSSGAFGASAGIDFLLIFDLISSDLSERILDEACHILVLLMIIVISVLFNLLAVTILLMKYSTSKNNTRELHAGNVHPATPPHILPPKVKNPSIKKEAGGGGGGTAAPQRDSREPPCAPLAREAAPVQAARSSSSPSFGGLGHFLKRALPPWILLHVLLLTLEFYF